MTDHELLFALLAAFVGGYASAVYERWLRRRGDE